jgi:hypothetical protein
MMALPWIGEPLLLIGKYIPCFQEKLQNIILGDSKEADSE